MTAGTLDARATIRRMNELNHAMDAYLGDLARAGHALVTGGTDGVWAYLEDYYRETFEHDLGPVSPADTTEAG